jgi:dimethylamine---corrinoid protein Co-methyltransferase
MSEEFKPNTFYILMKYLRASGMGVVRTAGDLVARLQISKSMKIGKARAYAAEKLGFIMADIRREKDIGLVHMMPGFARGLEAKLEYWSPV